MKPDIVQKLDELAKTSRSKPLGKWFVFPDPTGFAYRITTQSGPHRGLHIAEDVHETDAEFIVTLANSWPEISARLKSSEAVCEAKSR
jgi:hypothetical protein